jgi:hypothetical protein
MDLKSRLESHSVSTLKKEISKTNVKGYSKMKKTEVVALMLKHSDRFNHIKHAKSEEFKKEKIKEIMSKNEKPEIKSKGDFEKLKVKGKEYFYNKKNQKLYDLNTKKLIGKIEKGQVVLKKKEEPKKEEPKKEEPKKVKKIIKKPKLNNYEKLIKLFESKGNQEEKQEALKDLYADIDVVEELELTFQNNPKFIVMTGKRKGRLQDKYLNSSVATLILLKQIRNDDDSISAINDADINF